MTDIGFQNAIDKMALLSRANQIKTLNESIKYWTKDTRG